MLLIPLGLEPRFLSEETSSEAVIVYGNLSEPVRTGALTFRLSPDTVRFFDRVQPYVASDAAWFPFDDHPVPVPFRTEDGQPDPIASAFFWLSGWQEITTQARDVYGRFSYSTSLQAVWGIGDTPVVDIYREWLAAKLEKAGHVVPRRYWGTRPWAFLITHDIDALRYGRVSQFVHELLPGTGSGSVSARYSKIRRMTSNLVGGRNPLLNGLHRLLDESFTRGCRSTFFVKAGRSAAQDAAYALSGQPFAGFADRVLGSGCEIGLHPSFFAHTHEDRMRRELAALSEAIAPRQVSCVRQHYLRYDPSITPLLHERCGFHIDATLGFADREGFRRATCMPFRVFDVVRNRETAVWAYPLTMMDGTVFEYRKMSPAEACGRTAALMQVIRRFGGAFVGLWHNTVFDETAFPGWGTHFCFALDEALRMNACVETASETHRRWQQLPIPVHAE